MRKPNLPMAALLIAFLTFGVSAAAPKPAHAADAGGALTRSEFVAQRVKRAMQLDGDGDGKISLAEWSARSMGAGAAANGRDPAKAFARLDLNKDGALDAAELSRASDAAYSRLDADHDGKLSTAEQKAQLLQRRAALGK